MAIPPSHVNSTFQALCQVANRRAEQPQDFDEAGLTSFEDDQQSNCLILNSFYDSIGSDVIQKTTNFSYPEIKSLFEIFSAELKMVWNLGRRRRDECGGLDVMF